MIRFYPFSLAIENISEGLLKGISFAVLLEKEKVFDRKMVHSVRIGEEINNLENVFENLSKHYSNEIEQKSFLLKTILEPLLIIFIGIMVGILLVSMYLPMFEMNNIGF